MSNRFIAGLVAWLVQASAFAQAPAATSAASETSPTPAASLPTQGLFLEPVIGANLIGLQWDNNGPFLPGFELPPTLRIGGFFHSFALSGSLGLSTALDPSGGNGYLDVALGAQLKPYLWSAGRLRTYGLTGADVGFLLDGPSTIPEVSLTLGFGGQYFVNSHLAFGAEAGLRPKLIAYASTSGGNGYASGIYVALTGTWIPSPPAVAVPATVSAPPPPEAPALDPVPHNYDKSKSNCFAYVTDGWFEPSQGVWQDDPTFEDKPHKQLTRTEGDSVQYGAELDMVAGKDTLLFGVHHYRRGGAQTIVDSRDFIVLRGVSNCPEPVGVKMKFTLREGGVPRELFTSPVIAQVPLSGSVAPKALPWEVRLPAREGVPAQPFRFNSAVPYELKAELLRDSGAPTGLEMTLAGETKSLKGPALHFVPVVLSDTDAASSAALVTATETLAAETARFTPDLYPLPPEGLPTSVKVLRNFADQSIGSKWLESRRADATVAAIADSLNGMAFLEGAGRVVAVMSKQDFQSIFGAGAVGMTVDTKVSPKPKGPDVSRVHTGVELSWKVMLVPSDETWDTVAHEIVHTMPDGWADDEMQSECSRAYHNKTDPIAHGERIDLGGVPTTRDRKAGMVALMGPWEPVSAMWMTQCTYWHLLKEFDGGPPDPPVVLVRAVILRDGATVKGELRSLYTLWGHSDFKYAKPGSGFYIVSKDDTGRELARFPFTPRFKDIETGGPRKVVAVAYRVPWRPDLDTIELVGPNGLLDKKKLSSKDPEVEFQGPKDKQQAKIKDGKVHVTWTGKGDSDRTLLYSVLYSNDDGATYTTLSFEKPATEYDVPVDPRAKSHRIKISVTDGTRSANAEVRVTTPAAK